MRLVVGELPSCPYPERVPAIFGETAVECVRGRELGSPLPLPKSPLLGGSQVRGVFERQALMTRQSLSFFVHLEGTPFQRRKYLGDLA